MRNIAPSENELQGFSNRRDSPRIGALGMGGLGLADVLRLQAQAKSGGAAKGKSVIMVFDPNTAFLDYQGRPVHLLDDRDPIRELI